MRSRIGLRAIAAMQAAVMLLGMAALAHHRASGPHAAWMASAADLDAAAAASGASDGAAGDRHDCLLCRADHARYVPAAPPALVAFSAGAPLAPGAPPDGAAPAAAVDLLTAPKTSPPV